VTGPKDMPGEVDTALGRRRAGGPPGEEERRARAVGEPGDAGAEPAAGSCSVWPKAPETDSEDWNACFNKYT
jgi:hypothetical protein